MTRTEFENLDGQELASLVSEYDIYHIWENLIYAENLSDRVWDIIGNWDNGWETLGDFLNDTPDWSATGYFWENDYGEISSIDTDEQLKGLIYDDVLDYFDGNDLFEDEEVEDEEPSESQDDDGNVYYRDEDGNKYTVEIENVSILFFE